MASPPGAAKPGLFPENCGVRKPRPEPAGPAGQVSGGAAEYEFGVEDDLGLGSGRQPKYPIGTVAMYGPDDKTTTKIAAGVILHDGAEAIMQRWVAKDVTTNPKVQQELKDFFLQHGVNSVAMSEGNMGCPHEEGEDFPHGQDCPFCPFWKGKQGSNRKD